MCQISISVVAGEFGKKVSNCELKFSTNWSNEGTKYRFALLGEEVMKR